MPSESIVDDRVELAARQIAIGIGAADQREQLVFLPIAGGAIRDDLLRQDVERRVRDLQPVQLALTESRAPARRIRSARRAWWRRSGLSALRRPSGRSGRRAAARRRWTAAIRSGRPDRPCRCRCRVRATRSPPRPAVRRSSAALRHPGAVRATGCRDAAAPRSRPAARPERAPRARTSRRVLTNTSVVRCARISSATRS